MVIVGSSALTAASAAPSMLGTPSSALISISSWLRREDTPLVRVSVVSCAPIWSGRIFALYAISVLMPSHAVNGISSAGAAPEAGAVPPEPATPEAPADAVLVSAAFSGAAGPCPAAGAVAGLAASPAKAASETPGSVSASGAVSSTSESGSSSVM